MSLFNSKTLSRHINDKHKVPPAHFELLSQWAELIKSKRIDGLKEVALHGDFKSLIVEGVLGYKSAVADQEFTVASEQSILKGSVDLALGRFGGKRDEIVAPFELKGAKTKDLDAIMPGRAKSPVQQAWEYATNAPGVKWVIVSNYVELRLYAFGEGTQHFEKFNLAKLIEPREYQRFVLLLSAENLLSGRTAEILAQSRKEDKDITNALYADYKVLRDHLIDAVEIAAPNVAPLDRISAAQTILDRVLFTAFAEDTGLLPARILERAFEHADPFNPKPIWENFKGLFNAIDSGNKQLDVPPYNGGLFAPDPIIDALELPDLVCEGFKRIGEYDFASEVSVTVLGHIFEQSIADVERLQAIARGEIVEEVKKTGTTGRRKRDGVVYTPDYVARFIVDQTLGTHLRELFKNSLAPFITKASEVDDYENIKWKNKGAELKAWETYRDAIKALRIVDPACGSGVFLVTAFDFLKAELTQVNDKIASLRGNYMGDLLDPDSEILTHNLFGVDVNAESVEIAKLSLWIKTARKGKALDSLDKNLVVGDSLIEDSNFAYLQHGFSWQQAFPDVFAQGGFDVVLGNPPYVRMEFLKAIKPYLETRYEVVSDRADLYCYFYERGLRLLKKGGRLGYISSNTFFKTGSGKPLREYLAKNATIEHVVDFGDHQIFEGVTTYPAILTMVNQAPAGDHAISFWNVDELPSSNFRATYRTFCSIFPQSALRNSGWNFEAKELHALRTKICSNKKPLSDVFGIPMRGIVTGLNSAFIIDDQTKGRICAEYPNSEKVMRRVLKGNELARWRVESNTNWIIYTPKNVIEIDDFPGVKNWLLPFKDKLEMRAGKQRWFELQQAQEAFVPAFNANKISYIEVCNRGPFSFETSGFYQEATTFFIATKEQYLVSLLNSNVAWYFFVGTTTVFKGGYFRMKNQFVERLPIPPATDEQKQQLATLAEKCQSAAEQRYQLQQGVRRRIPDLCPPEREAKLNNKLKSWWEFEDFAAFRAEIKKSFKADIPLAERSDWEDWIARDKAAIARLTAEIKQHEDEINTLVYALFDLTDDEIQLLEANI